LGIKGAKNSCKLPVSSQNNDSMSTYFMPLLRNRWFLFSIEINVYDFKEFYKHIKKSLRAKERIKLFIAGNAYLNN
jgi:hypothetical protein